MRTDEDRLSCCQVALSTMDLARSSRWYQQALGFVPAGKRRHCEGQQYAAVPGLPEASFDVSCLIGRQDFVQIEMFQFERPPMRPMDGSRRLCDIGYAMIGILVPDFEVALREVTATGAAVLCAAVGEQGARRVCVRDPDGSLIELMEDAPGSCVAGDPALPAVASVTLSVPSVDAARGFWVDVLGCRESSEMLHAEKHEALWELEGSLRNALVLDAGPVTMELVEYRSPRGRPRPEDYRISDQGILNVAFGSTSRNAFDTAYRRALDRGFRGHTEPWTARGRATVVYLRAPQDFSVELLHIEPAALERMGFRTPERPA